GVSARSRRCAHDRSSLHSHVPTTRRSSDLKVVMSYQGKTLEGEVFAEAKTPVPLDLPRSNSAIVTRGTIAGVTEFQGAGGFIEKDRKSTRLDTSHVSRSYAGCRLS